MSKQPVLLAILDGFGYSKKEFGNAIANANTPFLNHLKSEYNYTYINASGEYVGLPENQIGNSEVGHLIIGAGRVIYTGLSLINHEIKTNKFNNNQTLLAAINHAKENKSNIHIMGLLSPGGVHSHQDHIFAMIKIITSHGLTPIIHIFGDGRDVAPKSIIPFIKTLQEVINQYGGKIATIAGRYYAMDRDKRWERTHLAYENLLGIGKNYYEDEIDYVNNQYLNNITDEFLLPARRNDNSLAIKDNDAIIHANFRPDRARQLSHLFCGSTVYEEKNKHPLKNLYYGIMMSYEGINPTAILFPTVNVLNTFGMIIADKKLKQLRIAETEKYAHVTYFFDGGAEITLPHETKLLIDSQKVATYDLVPQMSAVQITDNLLKVMENFDVIILNFANADMVGHTGKYKETVVAIETLDQQLHRIHHHIKKLGGTMFITADHGNAEEMIDDKNNPVTKHTTNQVIFISNNKNVKFAVGGSLANVAPTILDFMKIKRPSEMDKSLLIKK